MGRRPARRAPPAVPQAGARRSRRPRRRAGRWPRSPRRLRAADRAHERRPGGRRRLRGAGARARPDRPAAARGRCRPSRSTSSSCSCPVDDADAVRAALAEAGAGRIGDYDHARSPRPARAGSGRSRAPTRRSATVGERRGRSTRTGSRCVLPAAPARRRGRGAAGGAPLRGAGVRRDRAGRPRPSATGHRPDRHGRRRRRWRRSPTPVAEALPADRARRPGRRGTRTAPYAGSRCAAAPATSCSTRCSAADVDVYVTSDLRHHPAAEFLEQGGPALVDVAHWAAEWTWLPGGPGAAREALGDTVETRVSTHPHRPLDHRLTRI